MIKLQAHRYPVLLLIAAFGAVICEGEETSKSAEKPLVEFPIVTPAPSPAAPITATPTPTPTPKPRRKGGDS